MDDDVTKVGRAFLVHFTNATLDVPRHEEGLIAGAFTWGTPTRSFIAKLMGKKPQTRVELKERVERYLRQEEGEAAKQAYLNAMTTKHYRPTYTERPGGSRHLGRGKRSLGRFRPFSRDDRRCR
uniref:Uncharacterized protein n=1 Tax=Lactuca sativa TaxID=4236 RepID=A0A9R1VSC1_LACSA|nr:hypothetical protein LSAT_V11C400196130 [Lactuca sativa]